MTNDKQESADKIVGSTDGLGGCRHFCEACARRDDEIKRLRNLVKNFADVVEANAFAMKAPNSHTPIFVQLVNTARQSVTPNAESSGAPKR